YALYLHFLSSSVSVHLFIRHCSFFSCDCLPRDLHSFPTRRSSDLPFEQSDWDDSLWIIHSAVIDLLVQFQNRNLCNRNIGLHKLDRKSTRLNSSHVSISYAVFCLKKKYMSI